MKVKQVVDGFAVAEQIKTDDVAVLAEQGFRSIICNRPDGEAPDQPTVAEIKASADAYKLEFRNIPVISGQLTPADISAVTVALEELPKPILAYCRTGTRSIQLWALAEGVSGRSGEDILEAGQRAGYDLSAVVNWLRQN